MPSRRCYVVCILIELVLGVPRRCGRVGSNRRVPGMDCAAAATDARLRIGGRLSCHALPRPRLYPSTSDFMTPSAAAPTNGDLSQGGNDPGPIYKPYGSPEAMTASLSAAPDARVEQSAEQQRDLAVAATADGPDVQVVPGRQPRATHGNPTRAANAITAGSGMRPSAAALAFCATAPRTTSGRKAGNSTSKARPFRDSTSNTRKISSRSISAAGCYRPRAKDRGRPSSATTISVPTSATNT